MNDNKQLITAGIGLKPDHFDQALAIVEAGLWFEVHTENYFIGGGQRLEKLRLIGERFPLSFHGVGASLGGPELPDIDHLAKVKQLVDQFQPKFVSEHAVWSRVGDQHFSDLLPLPRTHEALQRLVDGISFYQDAIGRRILIENATNYLSLKSEMDEVEFLLEACKRSGCGLLLDVNNLYLSSNNCGIDAHAYIRSLPKDLVGEIHVAGYDQDEKFANRLFIDSHASAVSQSVWQLLDFALDQLGPKPVLLERDANIPPFAVLLGERQYADDIILRKTSVPHVTSI